jgi:hypothetical protein
MKNQEQFSEKALRMNVKISSMSNSVFNENTLIIIVQASLILLY